MKSLKKGVVGFFIFSFLFCLSAFGVTVSIPDRNVSSGTQTVDIPINIDDATGVAGFQFTITFDNNVLNATGATSGSLTGGWTVIPNIQNPGEIKIGGFDPSLTGISGGSGSLCILKFNVVGSSGSQTNLVFSLSKLSDKTGQSISHNTKNGSLTITANTATISGTISYTGTKTGTIYIGLFTSSDFSGEPVKGSSIANPGAYTIVDIPPGTYYVGAYRDSNGNNKYDPDVDPAGVYSGNPITLNVGDNKTGINITLTDPVVVIQFIVDKTSITVPEGGSDTFKVKLSNQPSGNVVVSITRVSGDSDISVSPTTITFTPENWNTYQTITVSAKEDDDVINGTATIRLSATGIQSKDITVTESDNDILSFVVDKDSLTVPEGGSDTFKVKLSNQPSGNVVVSITRVSGDSDISVNPTTITFTPTNWNTYQTITVSAKEDDDVINGTATIRLSATGIQNKDITATEIDNDTLSFVVDKVSLTVPEGGSNTFKVKLSNQPSGNVVVSITRVSGDSDISVSPNSITFTTTNWNTDQTITVSAAEDSDTEDGEATITISARGITSKTITATEIDNEVPTLSVSSTFIVFKVNENEKQIIVKNIGTKDSLIWEVTEDIDWLSISPTSGTLNANQQEQITIIRTNGNPGDSGKIIFKNKTEDSTQEDIEVNVRINRKPEVEEIKIYPEPINDIVRPETFITIIATFKDDDEDKINEYEYELYMVSNVVLIVDTDIKHDEKGFTRVKIDLPFALFEEGQYYNFRIRCKDENGEWSEWKEISNKFRVEAIIGVILLDENTQEDTTNMWTRVSAEVGQGVRIYVREIDPESLGIIKTILSPIPTELRMYDIRVEGLTQTDTQEIKFEIPGRFNTVWKYNPKRGFTPLSPGHADYIKLSYPQPNTTLVVIIFSDGKTPFDYDEKRNGVIVDPLVVGYVEEGPQQVSGGGGCFIATACFGDYNHPIVRILREFRDKFLLKNRFGKAFVRWYYSHSPKYAEIISKSPILKGVVRILLIPFVIFAYLLTKGLILPLVLILLLVFLFRKKALRGIILILLISFCSNLSAQDINHFKLIPGEKYTLTAPTRFLIEKGKFQIDLIYSYADSVVEGVIGGTNKKIISSQNLIQTGLTLGFSDRFNLSILIPYLINQKVLQGQPYGDSGFGDIYLIGKIKVWDGGRECYGVVLLPYIGFDTGDDDSLISANSTVYGIKFSFDKYLTDRLIGAINLGYSHQKKVSIGQINIDDTFLFGGSLIYLINEKIYLSGEIIGRSDNGIFKAKESTPVEAIVSLGWDLKNFQFLIGGGAGIVDGYGATNWRLFTGLKAKF